MFFQGNVAFGGAYLIPGVGTYRNTGPVKIYPPPPPPPLGCVHAVPAGFDVCTTHPVETTPGGVSSLFLFFCGFAVVWNGGGGGGSDSSDLGKWLRNSYAGH